MSFLQFLWPAFFFPASALCSATSITMRDQENFNPASDNGFFFTAIFPTWRHTKCGKPLEFIFCGYNISMGGALSNADFPENFRDFTCMDFPWEIHGELNRIRSTRVYSPLAVEQALN